MRRGAAQLSPRGWPWSAAAGRQGHSDWRGRHGTLPFLPVLVHLGRCTQKGSMHRCLVHPPVIWGGDPGTDMAAATREAGTPLSLRDPERETQLLSDHVRANLIATALPRRFHGKAQPVCEAPAPTGVCPAAKTVLGVEDASGPSFLRNNSI